MKVSLCRVYEGGVSSFSLRALVVEQLTLCIDTIFLHSIYALCEGISTYQAVSTVGDNNEATIQLGQDRG